MNLYCGERSRASHNSSTDATMPLFWVAFNLAMFPCSLACRRWPAPTVMGAAAVVAALAALAARAAPDLATLVAAQLMAGAAWAGVLVAAFAWALRRGGGLRAGTCTGVLASVLALATLARMAVVGAGWPKVPELGVALFWWPIAGWLAASAIVLLLRRPMPAFRDPAVARGR